MKIAIGVFRDATCFDVEEWFQQMLERNVQADCKLRRVPNKTKVSLLCLDRGFKW